MSRDVKWRGGDKGTISPSLREGACYVPCLVPYPWGTCLSDVPSMSPRMSPMKNFYKTRFWRINRENFLRNNPLCARCLREGRLSIATVVHHLKPHKGNWSVFIDRTNWESSCKPCHDKIEQSIERRGFDTGVSDDGWPDDPHHPINKEG